MIIQPVILSGGSGTRLWPLSREHYPKQLLAPVSDLTLLQSTVNRLDHLEAMQDVRIAAPLVICNEEHRFLVAEQLRQLGKPPGQILLEPVGRNTAPAATLAALHAGDRGAVLLIMPADHLIRDEAAFSRAVIIGARLASAGQVVTFGILPTRAETGYGYIHKGAALAGEASGARREAVGKGALSPDTSRLTPHLIEQFVEKPDAATAQSYLDSGEYLWNSGIFMVRAAVWLEAIMRHRPDIYSAAEQAYTSGKQDGDFYRVDKKLFATCPSDSIDYAVMEKLTASISSPLTPDASPITAAVIPLDAGWSDVGAWSSLWEVSPQDADGNILRGDVIAEDTRNSLLYAEHRLLAGVGLDNIIAIETADAILVVHKDKAQNVKDIVAHLKKQGRSEHQIHRRVHRPWGSYEGIDKGERFQVKRITVKPGASLSLQMHHHRAEHWIVVKGTARVVRGDDEFLLSENESTYIPIGVTHRLENPGTLPLELIEVQSGSYLGEDDIVRFEDHYGRK
ncbi:MAG: mannose-1-phosphate guanylyltransferase/mannose-6-phosphate isomerase [Gammaproteobacteria bacterium]|nr:mannose-1-phosphate guanylyltransferase/mannose-6-phosphate isomerase [Gammaproteobacteria bacterium]